MSRILLVEDDTMIASGILYALETEGYETNHATGIKDAGSLIEHYNFDLAIIDMQLPDGTGFDVSELKKNDCRNFCNRTCNIAYYNCNVLCDKRK